MNFLLLLLFPARFAHARYSSRMIDRFLNWGDHGKPKSGKIKGRCQPPPAQLMEWYFKIVIISENIITLLVTLAVGLLERLGRLDSCAKKFVEAYF